MVRGRRDGVWGWKRATGWELWLNIWDLGSGIRGGVALCCRTTAPRNLGDKVDVTHSEPGAMQPCRSHPHSNCPSGPHELFCAEVVQDDDYAIYVLSFSNKTHGSILVGLREHTLMSTAAAPASRPIVLD